MMKNQCDLCLSENTKNVYKFGDIEINTCLACNIVFTVHPDSIDPLLNIYKEDYFSGESEEGLDYMNSPAVAAYDKARFTKELSQINKIKKRGTVLDIGSATGHFLKIAKDDGWRTFGVEVSKSAADFAINNYALNIFNGYLSEASFQKEYFDVITLHHVLEHIPSPIDFLKNEVIPLLKKNGLLVIEVPNFASIHSAVNKERWIDLRPRQHLYHFTPRSLQKTIDLSGLKLLKLKTSPEPSSSILGPLVYLGIPEKSSRAFDEEEKSYAWVEPKENILRKILRNTSYILSRPLSFIYRLINKERRLVVYAVKRTK